MKVEWNVDQEIQQLGWKHLNDVPSEASKGLPDVKEIVDLGGGSGWFGSRIKDHHPDARVICIDITPRRDNDSVEHLRGSGLDIPIKGSSIDIVTVHAMLHHVPDHLDKCLMEIKRILKNDGIVIIQEPLDNNLIARIARKVITTTHHDEGEMPLNVTTLHTLIKKQFEIKEEKYYFLLSYLVPHILPRIPGKYFGRTFAKLLVKLDMKLLADMPKLRMRSAYISVVACKRSS